MKKVEIAIIIIVLILAGIFVWRDDRAQEATLEPVSSQQVNISGIALNKPKELNFKSREDGAIYVNLRPDIENIIDFHGLINTYRDFDEYQEVNGHLGVGGTFNPLTRIWISLNKNATYTETELLKLVPYDRTDRGDPVVTIGYGDAGGTYTRHFIFLKNPPQNSIVGLVEMTMWTYEDPSIWGTRESERQNQHELLKQLFGEMVRTVRFAG